MSEIKIDGLTEDILAPKCPIVFFKSSSQNNIYYLHIQSMDVHVECYIETALVTMKGVWEYYGDEQINCVFMIPMRGEVMDCTIEIDKKDNNNIIRTTAIVPFRSDELEEDNEISQYKLDEFDDDNKYNNNNNDYLLN